MYLDTSVLVKLFTTEPDSEFYGRLVDGQAICSSMLAYTEVRAAMAAKERAKLLSPELRQRAWRSFEWNVTELVIELSSMTDAILRRANWVIERAGPQVPLRSLDAIHLATADQLQNWPLVTHDPRVRAAAKLMGYPLADRPPSPPSRQKTSR